jgi:hypothetical protein
MPQSTANLALSVSIIKQDPVTALAAPRNLTFIKTPLPMLCEKATRLSANSS